MTRAAPRPVDATAVLMGLTFALIWSSAFTFAKIALADAPPFLMLAARFALSGVVAVLVACAMGARPPRGRAVWRAIVIFGICQNTLYLGLNFLAMTRVEAGLAAIVASALPLAVAALSRVSEGERLSALGLAGLATGFGGVVLIMGARLEQGADPLGLALCLAGLAALAVATLQARAAGSGGAGVAGVLMAVGLQMLIGSATLAPIGLLFESVADVRPTLSLALAFAYTTIAPGVIATVIWFLLVARIGATSSAAFHFLNPGFGVGIAWAMLGEPLGWTDLIGVAVVTAGIAAVQIARGRSPKAKPPPRAAG